MTVHEKRKMASELSLDFSDPDCKPYFLWSEDMTVAQLREILAGLQGPELKISYMARIMRECRIPEVWQFLELKEILMHWESLQRHLGRSRRLWNFLLEVWSRNGLISART